VKAGAALLVIDNLATGELFEAGAEERRKLEIKAAKGALKALARIQL
jgi:hypothetical protein